MKQVLVEKTPPSPMPPPSMSNTSDYLMNTGSGTSTPGGASDLLKSGGGKGPGAGGDSSDDILGKKKNIIYKKWDAHFPSYKMCLLKQTKPLWDKRD